MIFYFYLLIPSMIGTEIYKLLNKECDIFTSLKYYIINLLIVNTSAIAVTVKFWEGYSNIENYLLDCPAVGVKYAIFASIFSILISFIVTFIQKNFRLEMNIIEKEKEHIENNK